MNIRPFFWVSNIHVRPENMGFVEDRAMFKIVTTNSRLGLGVGHMTTSRLEIGHMTNSRPGVGHMTNSRLGVGHMTNNKLRVGHMTNSRLGVGHVTNSRLGVGNMTNSRLGRVGHRVLFCSVHSVLFRS